MPEIAQFLKRNISLSIQNTPKKISPLYLFFQSENDEYNIVQIPKKISIAVFMTLQSLPTHLLKNWDGFEYDFFPCVSCMIDDLQQLIQVRTIDFGIH